MKRRVFYSEIAYLAGLVILALGTALMEKANFGVSMVVAPAYILYLKISESLLFFSFRMPECNTSIVKPTTKQLTDFGELFFSR